MMIPFNQNQNVAFNSVNLKYQTRDSFLIRTLVFIFNSVNLRSYLAIPFNQNQNVAFNSTNLKSQSRDLFKLEP
jgi:hypothetical protein